MEFLTFRKMVTPIFIQLLFWLGVIAVIIAGVVTMTVGDEPILGILMVILGPLVVRIYAELLIVLFRIHSSLNTLVKLSQDNAATAQPASGTSAWQQSAATQPATGYGQQSSQQGYTQQQQQQGDYTQPSPPSSPPPQGPPPSGPPSP